MNDHTIRPFADMTRHVFGIVNDENIPLAVSRIRQKYVWQMPAPVSICCVASVFTKLIRLLLPRGKQIAISAACKVRWSLRGQPAAVTIIGCLRIKQPNIMYPFTMRRDSKSRHHYLADQALPLFKQKAKDIETLTLGRASRR